MPDTSLPDNCFAYVPADAKGENGAKSKRKLNLCNDAGEIDAGMVGAAAAALGPGYRGNRVELPPDDRSAAVRKVRAAWRRVNPDKDPDEMPSGIHASESGVPDEPAVATFAVRDAGDHPALHVFQPLDFAEPPEWAPFLPVPGTYQHPVYGPLDFSPDAYDRIIANFKSGAYQERIPVNAEHDPMASGAVGWITDMRRAENGAIDAKVEWNDRGKALIEGDRFRYVSAEVIPHWSDPVDPTKVYRDVAVGLAICTNPYFKESVLRPLAASEAAIRRVEKEQRMSDQEGTPSVTTTAPPEVGGDDKAKQYTERLIAELGGAKSITDPIVLDFVEKAAARLAQSQDEADRAKEQAAKLTEQNAILTAQNRVKLFTDEVMGHGAHSGIAYVGEIKDHVRMLCSLANTYGEASWEVQHYKKTNREQAEQIKAGSLFKEIGVGRGGDAALTAHDQIDALARELVAANPKLSHAQAFTQVLTNNAELRAAHARERQANR